MQRNGFCVSRRDRGASAVEFALIMPLFFILLFGIVDFGWFFFNQHTIQYATREGVRLALVGGTLKNPDGSSMSREASIIKEIKDSAAAAVNPANLRISIFPVKADDYSDPNDWDTADPDAGAGGDFMRVRVRYTYQYLTPMIGTFLSDKIIQAEALYRNELF